MNDAGPFSKKASDEIDRRRKDGDPAQMENDKRNGYHFIHGHFPEDIFTDESDIFHLDDRFVIDSPEEAAHTLQYKRLNGEEQRRVYFDGIELMTDKGEPVYFEMFDSLSHLRQMIENGDAMLDEAFNEEDETPELNIQRILKHRLGIGHDTKCPCGSGKKYKECCMYLSTTAFIAKLQNGENDE